MSSVEDASILEFRSPLGRLVLRITAFFIFLIIVLTFCQVVSRYLFNFTFAWVEEVSRYLFMWIVALGSAVAFQQGAHMSIDAVDAHLPKGARRYLHILRIALSIVAVGFLTYSGILVAWRNRGSSFFSLPGFPAVLGYMSVPVAGFLMLWFLSGRILPLLSIRRKP